jgi:cytochrome c553
LIKLGVPVRALPNKIKGVSNMKVRILLVSVVFALMAFTISTWAGGDAAAGETKSAGCAGCHGSAGEGSGDNPPIAGLDEAYHVEQLMAYKSGERTNAMMQMFAGQLSEEDMADIAAYYASLAK